MPCSQTGLLIYPSGQLCAKLAWVPLHRWPSLGWQSLCHSPDKWQDGNGVPSPALSRGHRAASLLEDGLPGQEKWSDHTPCYCGPKGMALHNPLDDEDDRGDEILSLFQETSVWWSLKRRIGLQQKLRCCPWDRWSRGKGSGMYGLAFRKCTLYFISFHSNSYLHYPLLWTILIAGYWH